MIFSTIKNVNKVHSLINCVNLNILRYNIKISLRIYIMLWLVVKVLLVITPATSGGFFKRARDPSAPKVMKEEYSFSVVRKYAEIIYLNLRKIMDGNGTFIFKYTKQCT